MQVRGKNKMFTEVADKNHSHSNYALTNHSHNEYAMTEHSHNNYISKLKDIVIASQTGAQLGGAGGGIKIDYPQGFNNTNCIPLSLMFATNDKPNEWSMNGYRGTDHEYLFYPVLGDRFIMVSYRSFDGGGSLDDAKHHGTLRIVLMKTVFVL